MPSSSFHRVSFVSSTNHREVTLSCFRIPRIASLLVLLAWAGFCVAQVGNVEIVNHPPKDYYSEKYQASPQNWCITQDDHGLMYIANESGILTFDGETWSMVPGTERQRFFKLAIGPGGYVYSGGTNDLGFIAPDSIGRLRWHSLKHALPDSVSSFAKIFRTIAHADHVYFLSSDWLFEWDGRQMRAWSSPLPFQRIFSSKTGLLVHVNQRGLLLLEEDGPRPITSGDRVSDMQIRGVFDQPDGSYLILSLEEGAFRLNQQGLTRLSSALDSVYVFNSCRLPNGNIAVGTNGDGLFVIDQNARVLDIINESKGLHQNQVVWAFVDREGALWVSLFSGVSRISLQSPLTHIGKANGLKSIAVSMCWFKGQLYVGTMNGCFRLEASRASPEPRQLKRIEGLREETLELLRVSDRLVAICQDGLFEIEPGSQAKRLTPGRNFIAACVSSMDTNRFFVVQETHIQSFRLHHDQWQNEGVIAQLDHPAFYLVEDAKGRLWASYNQLSMVEKEGDGAKVTAFNSSMGLRPEMEIMEVFTHEGQVRIGNTLGLYAFNEETGRVEPCHEYASWLADGSSMAYTMEPTRDGDIWMTTSRGTGVLRKGKPWSLDLLPLASADFTEAWAIYEDPNQIVWVSTTEGLWRYDPFVQPDRALPYKVRISEVKDRYDSLLFAGRTFDPGHRHPLLSYTSNLLRFRFSANYFETRDQLVYSHFLEGEDTEWSAWDKATSKEFANLREGDYTFRVKARNAFGVMSEVSTFRFTILPPWYRTIWAYLLYGILGSLLLWIALRVNTIRLRRAKKALEIEVAERTKEIAAQAQALKTAHDQLLELDRFKEGMTTMIVHDLKNPLNAILAADESKPSNAQLSQLKRVGRQMLHLVSNILDVSRYENAGLQLELTSVAIRTPMKQAIEEVFFLARQKRIRLMLSVHPKLIVRIDEEVFVRILVNLLTNAIKFSPPGSTVVTRAESEQVHWTRISVKDEGPGIREENRQKIFERFGQVTARKSGELRATGLGLTFCKMAAEAHGGQMDVESSPGEGSLFWFTVPCADHFSPLNTDDVDTETFEPHPENAVQLTATDIHYLAPFGVRLQSVPVYKVSHIEDILSEVDHHRSTGIQQWCETIERSIQSGDQEGLTLATSALVVRASPGSESDPDASDDPNATEASAL